MKKGLPDQLELAALKLLLREVNGEWRELARKNGSAAKLSRLGELRAQRLALTTSIFNIERQEGLIG